jgi:hypothetical protein
MYRNAIAQLPPLTGHPTLSPFSFAYQDLGKIKFTETCWRLNRTKIRPELTFPLTPHYAALNTRTSQSRVSDG